MAKAPFDEKAMAALLSPEEERVHPLIDGKGDFSASKGRATSWVLHRWVPEGLCSFAGDAGTGKTSAIFPMALSACGLIKPDIGVQPSPDKRRKLIYHSEDVGQIKRMLELLKSEGLIIGDVDQWLTVVEAKRLPVEQYLQELDLEPFYSRCCRNGVHMNVPPLVVFDTYTACFQIDDENSNSEVGKAIERLKQVFKDALGGIWIVAHTAKGSRQKTARGASALEGSVVQSFSITREAGGLRWMTVGKKRSDLFAHRLVLRATKGSVGLLNEWNELEAEEVTVSFPSLPTEEEKAAASGEKDQQLKGKLREVLSQGPKGKTELIGLLGGRKAETTKLVNQCLANGDLVGEKAGGTLLVSLPK